MPAAKTGLRWERCWDEAGSVSAQGDLCTPIVDDRNPSLKPSLELWWYSAYEQSSILAYQGLGGGMPEDIGIMQKVPKAIGPLKRSPLSPRLKCHCIVADPKNQHLCFQLLQKPAKAIGPPPHLSMAQDYIRYGVLTNAHMGSCRVSIIKSISYVIHLVFKSYVKRFQM